MLTRDKAGKLVPKQKPEFEFIEDEGLQNYYKIIYNCWKDITFSIKELHLATVRKAKPITQKQLDAKAPMQDAFDKWKREQDEKKT